MNVRESTQLKGIALIIMFIHHLFGVGSFLILDGNHWNSAIPYLNLETYIGIPGRICVALFLFLSGYGLYKSYLSKEKLKKFDNTMRIIKFLISYWVIMFFVAIPYLVYAKKFDISNLFINLFALLHNDDILYVSFSWYVKLYLGILLILPLFKLLIKKSKFILDIFLVVGIAVFSYATRRFIYEAEYLGLLKFVVSSILLIVSYFPIFYAGVIFSKYSLFEKIGMILKKFGKWIGIFVGLAIMMLTLYIRSKINIFVTTDIIYSSSFAIGWYLFVSNLTFKFMSGGLLQYLGKNSFQYWLLSGMFFLNTIELQRILFINENALVILIWTFLIITPFAIITNKLSNVIYKFLNSLILKKTRNLLSEGDAL